MIRSFEDLEVYQRSKKLYPRIVRTTKSFPPHLFHLRDQTCRSANAIHADIAEGFGRSTAEFRLYLTKALGSCNETISHLGDAMNVGAVEEPIGRQLLEEYTIVGKQIYRLREAWKNPSSESNPQHPTSNLH